MIGRTVAHYRILERLGGGGMGVVYRAEDTRLQRSVALKFLPTELTQDPEAKQRLLVEARAASALDDPNVCTVYEVGETEDGQMYLAMAYYDGETLKNRIARGPLPVSEALDLTTQIARGLARAHEAGILHRDIKPANVMVTERGEAKIVDFGVAKLAAGSRLTRPGTTLGTPVYMSPEQIRGEDVDARTDLWSLGVVLYEMVTGKLPFKGDTDPAAIHSILNREAEPMASRRPEVSQLLQGVVDRLLAKKPAARYSGAGELVDELLALQRQAESATLTGAVARPSPRRTPPWAIVGGALALLAGLAVYLATGRPFSRPSGEERAVTPQSGTAIAVLPFTVRGGEEYHYLGQGIVDLLGTKLDGAGELRSIDPHALLSFVGREIVPAPGEPCAGPSDTGLPGAGPRALGASAAGARGGRGVPRGLGAGAPGADLGAALRPGHGRRAAPDP